jgi:uncharacterized protein YegP (UPF0339 family)
MLRLALGTIIVIVAKRMERTKRVEQAAKFIIYRGFDGGYRWRLRSLAGETIAASKIGYHEKSECAQELECWRLEYPDAAIRDATVRSPERQLQYQR